MVKDQSDSEKGNPLPPNVPLEKIIGEIIWPTSVALIAQSVKYISTWSNKMVSNSVQIINLTPAHVR